MSLVAEFALRLLAGLSAALLLVPPRQVPPAFFRTLSWVALGISVLAAFDLFSGTASTADRVVVVTIAVLAYLASACWGIGLPRLGAPLTAAQAAGAAGLLAFSFGASTHPLEFASRLASGLYLGSILVAMLLGHHYLTAPSMTTAPLLRATLVAASSLALRVALAIAAIVRTPPGPGSSLLLLMRWTMGLAVPAIGLLLAWRTARIRSTQSATGILYATIILALLGELASQVLARSSGITY